MFYQQNQKFGFRKSKAFRTLCGAVLGTFLVLAVQTANADEITDSTVQSQPQVETVVSAPVTTETTTETPVVTSNVTTTETPSATDTHVVVDNTATITPAETTNVTNNVTTTDSTESQYASEKAKEVAKKAFSNVDTSNALTSEDIKTTTNLTNSQNEVLDSVKESLDALPANVRSVAKSVTVIDENDGNLGYTASVSGKVTINAHYFDTNNVDESTAVLYHEIGHTIDGATYDRASNYSLSRDEAVQPLLKTVYPGQPNYEAFASLFGTYMLQETGQKAVSTAVDMEIKKYFDTVLKGFTTPKSDSITKPLLDTVDSLRAKGKVVVFDGMVYTDSAQEARDLNNKTIARLTNTRRARAITSPVSHFTAATTTALNNVTVSMSSTTPNTNTDNVNTFNTARTHELTVNVSGTGEVGDNSYIDVTVETNVPVTDTKASPFVDDFKATSATDLVYGKNTQHAKLTLTGIAAGIQKGFTIQTNSLNTDAPITSTVTRTSTYKLVVDGNIVDTKVITETFVPAEPAVTKADNIQTYTIIKDTDAGTTTDQYTFNQNGQLAINGKRAYGIVDIQVPKNITVSDNTGKDFESYKVIEGETAHYLIPQNEVPEYVSTDTKADAKAAVADNASVKRLDQAGKIVYYYGDSPLTATLDSLKTANHIDKNFAIATSINTQIEQLGNLQMDARLGNDRVNVLATNNSNYYSVNMSNGSPTNIRKEVPLYGVEIDFNRDDKNIYQGNYQVEGTDSNKHPYNVYNADTNELVGTINGTRFNIPKSVSRIRIEPKDPTTVGYGPNATIKNVIFNVFFNGTDETAEAWKKNMDAGQVSSETTRFDAKLLNQDLSVAAQKNHTLTITNEFIGTRLADDSYVFFTPTTTTNYVTMPLLVTNSLRGKLPTSAIKTIEIKDKYGIIGRNFNNNFRASDEFQPISLFIDNAGNKVTEAHRANTGNFVDTVYNGGASNNTYVGLTAQLPAGTHIYDIPVRLTTFDGVSVVEKDGSTSTSNVTEATLRIVTYDSKTTGTSSFISSSENSGTNIKILNVDNGLVATTYVNNFTESDVNQLTAMSYIPKTGIEGSTANTTLKSAVTAPAGWKVMYTTDAISGNYKTDRNLNFTDSVTDYSKVTAIKFVSTNSVKASTATPFEVPLNFEGTVGNDKVNYRSVLLTDDKELLSTPVTAKPATGNIVYEYRMLLGKNLIKSENSGDKFTERTENYTFGETITDAQGRKYHRAQDGDANTVSTVVKEGTTTITRYYLADNVTTITVKYELDMTDEATKLASEGKIGMPEFANGVLANVNNPLSDLRLEDSQLFVGDRVIQAGDRWGFSPNHYKTFEETPDIDYTGKNVVLEYTRLSATASPDLKELFDNYVKTGALVDMADDGTPMMMVNVEGTNAENSHATITYYYKIRSGSITQHFVDEQGNKLADDTTTGKLVADASVVNVSYPSVITKDGATYNYVRNNQTGTLTPSTLGQLTQVGEGNNSSIVLSPNGDVDITYVYKKATKDVIIRHLVDRTDKVTEDFMTNKIYAPDLIDTDVQSEGVLKPETRQTINKEDTVTVTDPSDKIITKDSDVSITGLPVTFTYARKVVTQDGDNTIISYYYTVDSGSITQHFIDESGNKLFDDTTTDKLVADVNVVNVAYPSTITKNGVTYNYVRNNQTGTLTPSTLSQSTQVGTGNNSSNVLSPNSDVDITYVYKRATKDVIIRHLVDRTDKVTEDFMTNKIYAPDLSDTDVQSKGILKPETRQTINKEDTVTATDPSDKIITKDSDISQTSRPVTFTYARKVVTQDGDNTIISYYYTVDRGRIIQQFVDESGNKLLDNTTTENYVAESLYISTNHPTRITKNGIVYGLVKTENPLPAVNTAFGVTTVYNDFGTNPSESITALVPHGDATITYTYKELKGTIIQHFVDTDGNKLIDDAIYLDKPVDEAVTLDHPKRIDDEVNTWVFVRQDKEDPTKITEGTTEVTYVYEKAVHEVPGDAPQTDKPEAKATVYIDEQGNSVKTPDEGLHDGPKVIEDKWQYVRTIPEKDGILTHVYTTITHKIPNDAPQTDKPEAKATVYVDENGNNVKIPDEGLHDGPKVIGDKWQYVKTIPEKDGILTHVYTTITHEIPGDAPQTDKPELEVTRYVSDKGEELKETEEGTKDAPKVLKDKWQYDHTEPKKDGITTHVYVQIEHEIPNEAPQTDKPEAKATIYVDESGNNVKIPDEGLHEGPKVIEDKWQYIKTIPEKDGILTHVYTTITHEIPNEAPQTDKPEAKATVYINEQGETVKTPGEGLHDGPKVIEDKWQYVKTIPEKDGILTHVYTEIKHEIPNNPPIVEIPEAKATVYVNEAGKTVKTPDEGLHDGPKVINDKWQYTRTIPEKDGILTHVYTEITHNIPNNPPIVDIPEAKVTVYVDENGNNVKTPDNGLHEGPKVIEDKWQYVKTIPEKDGILTHVYTTITHGIPNNPPIVDIPELEVTRYIDEHGKDIKDPEPGTKEAPKTIGKYEFSRTIPKKDGVTTHVYKEVKRETPNKPTPNTDKHIPNKPVDKTPKVEQPVNETVVKTQETVNNTVQSAPAKTNELPHTGDNDSSKALAVSGLAMFMAGIVGVFRKKKQ